MSNVLINYLDYVCSIKYLWDYIKPRQKQTQPEVERFTPTWHKFICPMCGNNVFHYLPNNQIKCTNCGGIYQMQGSSIPNNDLIYH